MGPGSLTLVGQGDWAAAMALRWSLQDFPAGSVVVVDYDGSFRRALEPQAAARLSPRLVRWIDLGDRRTALSLYRFETRRGSERVLSALLRVLAGIFGRRNLQAAISEAVHLAAVLCARSADSDGTAVVGLMDLLRALRSPLLRERLLPQPPSVGGVGGTAELVSVLMNALAYPGVFRAISGGTSDSPVAVARGLTVLELPATRLESVEEAVLAAMVDARIAADVLAWESEGAAPGAVVKVVRLDGKRSHSEGILSLIADRAVVASAHRARYCGAQVETRLQGLGTRLWLGPGARPNSRWTRAPRALEPYELYATSIGGTTGEVVRVGSVAAVARPGDEALVRGWRPARKHELVDLAAAARAAIERGTLDGGLLARVANEQCLRAAWHRVRHGSKSAGTDGVTLERFAAELEENLADLSLQLLRRTYRPSPLRRVELAKEGGGTRMVGVGTVRDRVAQSACLDVLDPILDRLLSDRCYAYRPRRSAGNAVLDFHATVVARPECWILKCDIRKCFDTIDHELLLEALSPHVPDADLIALIRAWARAEVVCRGEVLVNVQGVPQGSALAPLLANLYLDPVDRTLEGLGVPFARYADDIVVRADNRPAADRLRGEIAEVLRTRLRMTLHPDKTQIVSAPDGIDFLGFRVSSNPVAISDAKVGRLLDRVGQCFAAIRGAKEPTGGALVGAALTEALRALGALLRGFSAYYLTVGPQRAIVVTLAKLDHSIDELAARQLPPEVLLHPEWMARPRLLARTPSEPVDASGVGYPEVLDRAAPAMPSPVESEATTNQEPSRDAVLLQDGLLTVLRPNVYLTLREEMVEARMRRKPVFRIPIQDVESVMLHGFGVAVSSTLILRLASAQIPVVISSPTGTDMAAVTGPESGRPRLRVLQARHAELPDVIRAGIGMLEAKVSNQASLLRYYAKYRRRRGSDVHEQLDALAASIRQEAAAIGAIPCGDRERARASAMGHEGRAAALYWSGVALLLPEALGFPGRCTRNASDPVNQSFNYVYGCLYPAVWRALALAGMDPFVGILHGSERASASLVFDMIEEFRCGFADRVVLSLIGRGFRPELGRDGMLRGRTRRGLLGGFQGAARRRVEWCGTRSDLRGLLERRARSLAVVFRDGHGESAAFHLRW